MEMAKTMTSNRRDLNPHNQSGSLVCQPIASLLQKCGYLKRDYCTIKPRRKWFLCEGKQKQQMKGQESDYISQRIFPMQDWFPWHDLNMRMMESKSIALPLGYTEICCTVNSFSFIVSVRLLLCLYYSIYFSFCQVVFENFLIFFSKTT